MQTSKPDVKEVKSKQIQNNVTSPEKAINHSIQKVYFYLYSENLGIQKVYKKRSVG